MSKFYMALTILLLPFYWIRSQILRRWGSETKINKEMKMYPRHYFGVRNIAVVSHNKKLDINQNYVFVSNHQSHNDIFLTIAAIDHPFRFVAKKELFESIVTGTFMKMSQSYPLDREDARKSLTILKEVVKDANSGYSVLVFPEGTRSYKKDLLEFKDGIFSMLRKVKIPIVTLYIKESFNENQKQMNVYFDEPIYPKDFNDLKGVELSLLIKDRMNNLKEIAYL